MVIKKKIFTCKRLYQCNYKVINLKTKKKINIYNLGLNETITVEKDAKIMWLFKLKPKFIFSGGKRGWIGDVPLIKLSTKKIKKTGWVPNNSIKKV